MKQVILMVENFESLLYECKDHCQPNSFPTIELYTNALMNNELPLAIFRLLAIVVFTSKTSPEKSRTINLSKPSFMNTTLIQVL